MGNTPRRRVWIKVQLSVQEDAEAAATIVLDWKLRRQAARHIVRAVTLYAGLLRGDLALLDEYFPGFVGNVANSRPAATRHAVPTPAAPVITYSARSETEDLDDVLDGLGLDDLDFG